MRVLTRVVIVDDRWQFVLHAWRIISGTLGFGIGRRSPKDFEAGLFLLDYTANGSASDDEGDTFRRQNEEHSLRLEGVCPDGRCSVCWIHPKGADELETFKRLHEEALTNNQRVISLVDVDLGNDLPPDGFKAYVVAHMDARKKARNGQGSAEGLVDLAEDLVVVSSYRCDAPLVSGTPIVVWPKTTDTLTREVTSRLPRGGEEESTRYEFRVASSEARDLQILVTGAGFELGETIGLPDTGKIIESLKLELPHDKELLFVEREGFRFPMPFDPAGAISEELEDDAKHGNLDAYWNVILRSFRRRGGTHPAERGSQSPSFVLELRMRELFRRAIERYDVGHMRQALIAASQPWDVWLTTNYTRFANRAIRYEDDRSVLLSRSPRFEAPSGSENGGAERARTWDTISNAEEASLLHRVTSDDQGGGHRYLIKLHGDVSQVYTMAIAGEDKEPFSDLLIQPEIYPIYAAALEFVCLSAKSAQRCVWHVVGHSLYDRALTRIFRLAVDRSDVQHHFVLAGPEAKLVERRVARDWAREWGSAWERVELHAVDWRAERYMASLQAAGGPPHWRDTVPSRPGELKVAPMGGDARAAATAATPS